MGHKGSVCNFLVHQYRKGSNLIQIHPSIHSSMHACMHPSIHPSIQISKTILSEGGKVATLPPGLPVERPEISHAEIFKTFQSETQQQGRSKIGCILYHVMKKMKLGHLHIRNTSFVTVNTKRATEEFPRFFYVTSVVQKCC